MRGQGSQTGTRHPPARQNPTLPDMHQLTIGRMAKLYGLHRSTLYEAVEKGRVTAGFDGKGQRVIALSEMIRVYGEPPGLTRQNPTPQGDANPTPREDALQPLLDELRALREEVKELRQALRLLPAPTHPPETPKCPPDGERAPSSADDDPHGFRAMVRALRDQ